MKRLFMHAIALLLCVAMLPMDFFAVFAAEKDKVAGPPAYMRELSRLVMETASEDDFGEIQLTIGEPEMEVDGETQPITDDERVVPYEDENGELQIPVEVMEEAPLNGSGFLSEEELEKQGYDVQTDDKSGTVIITEPYQQCRLIVKTRNGRVKNTYGATHVIHISNNKTVLQYADKETTKKAAAAFKKESNVLFCAADGICSVSATTETTEYKCWGTEVAGADQFMAALPDDLPQVTVAVIDTGVDASHPFLEGRIAEGGWDFVCNDDDPDDEHYHGTHCAGIIRDATPDNVKILPVRVLDCNGAGFAVMIAEGMNYAVDNGADILSLSFGGRGNGVDEILDDAVCYALSYSVSVIAAAGNDNVSLDEFPTWPASCDGVITVSAVTQQDTPTYFTNYGSAVDVAAPGSAIVSSVPDGKYRSLSGTSMACPLVAACAALLKSEDATRTPDDLLALLRAHTRDAYTSGRDDYTGCGIVYLGAYRAVEKISFNCSELVLEPLQGVSAILQFDPPHPSDCTVTFSSSDPSVVVVDDTVTGILYAVGSGTAQITATNGQGCSAELSVSVYGEQEYSQIVSGGNSMLFLQNDHTAYAYGRSGVYSTGYYSASSTGWPFKFQSAPNEPVQDIERFWMVPNPGCTVFSKTDETIWMCGHIDGHNYNSPVQTWIDDETPMTDAIDVQSRFLLRRDGTLWTMEKSEDPYWSPVLTEDGTPLGGVYSIQSFGSILCAVTLSGIGYSIQAPSMSQDWPLALPIRDSKGDVIYGIQSVIWGLFDYNQKYKMTGTSRRTYPLKNSTILLRDGTVIDQDRNILLQDVAELSRGTKRFNGIWTILALKRDGTVWDLTAKQQIMKSETEPLTNVVKLCAGDYWFHALCADGTVWTWGRNGDYEERTDDSNIRLYGVMGVGWLDSRIVEDARTGAGTQPLQSISPDGLTYSHMIMSGPYSRVSPVTYATQVMENAQTPLTGVTDLSCSQAQVLYYKEDGTVNWSGIVQYTFSGLVKMAVYAIPMQFFGRQVRLRKTDVPAAYSPERLQTIRLDKPAMAAVVGETFTLTASLTPANTRERNIFWRSSDTNVAVVDNRGVVTAKGVGVASIRAYCTSNSKVWGQCLLSVEEEAPTDVTLRQPPTKRSYTTADTVLDTSGGSLLLTYRNGQQRGISISPEYCSGFDFTQTGAQTVTITYGGQTLSYSITVTEPQTDPPVQDKIVTGIRWEKYPHGCVGLLGGNFVVPNASIRVLYADGSFAVVPLTAEMCSGYDMQQSMQIVTVTYEAFTLQFSLVLRPRLLWEGLPPEQSGLVDGRFIAPDARVWLQNDDGSVTVLPLTEEMCSGYDMQTMGEQTVTVTVEGYTLSYRLHVRSRLSWNTYPDSCVGVIGGRFVIAKASACMENDDGSVTIIPLTAEMCSGYDMQQPGEQTVTVTVEGFTLSYTLTLVPRLSWVNEPAEPIEIPYGEQLTVPDATFMFYYDDGASKIVTLTAGMCTGYDPYTCGTQTVTVQYATGTLTFSVRVGFESVVSVEIETLPAKRCYAVNKDTYPDVTGGTLRVTFADGSQTVVPMSEATVRYTPRYAGAGVFTNTVYLDYCEQTVSYIIYNLNYWETLVEEAFISKMPDKVVYTVGERYDLTGGRIYARTPDGAEGEEDMKNWAIFIPGFFKEPGEYTVYFRVGTQKVPITLVVKEATEADDPDEPDDPYPDPDPDDPDPDDPDLYDPDPFDPGSEPSEGPVILPLFWRYRPSQTLYCIGEQLDVSDASFTIGRSSHLYDVTPDMCSVDMTTPGNKTVTVTFDVVEDEVRYVGTLTFDIVVCGLELENEVPEIEVGKCTRILATFAPRDIDGREIIWSSSDESVATVDEYGRVTGITPGEVEITAQVKGSEATASCTVTVLPRTAERIPGDADGDGAVDLKDIVRVVRYLAGGWDAVIDLINSDVNGDGAVNLKDVVLLRRYLAGGWDVTLQE